MDTMSGKTRKILEQEKIMAALKKTSAQDAYAFMKKNFDFCSDRETLDKNLYDACGWRLKKLEDKLSFIIRFDEEKGKSFIGFIGRPLL